MTTDFTRMHVIANPAAGQDDTVIATLNEAFHPLDMEWEISVTHQFGDGARLAREAIEAGADVIGVYGGDGTIGDVLNGVYPSDIPIAVLSGGTGNGVARVLGIPGDLIGSTRHITSGEYDLLKMDIGRIGDRVFLLRVDIGKTVEVVEELTEEDKERYGMFAYFYATHRTFTAESSRTFTFTCDGERFERDAGAFVLLNLRRPDPGADERMRELATDGHYEFFVIRNRLVDMVKGVAAYANLADTEDMFEVFSAARLTVETPEPLTVLADGEPCGQTPVTIEVLPQAVTMVLPRLNGT
jgi:YegS/Rv2252/BmrU family lipid kinase